MLHLYAFSDAVQGSLCEHQMHVVFLPRFFSDVRLLKLLCSQIMQVGPFEKIFEFESLFLFCQRKIVILLLRVLLKSLDYLFALCKEPYSWEITVRGGGR